MTTIVYIAGYGRSGSTLLDLLLGMHPAVRSLGEAGMIWDQLEIAGAECSCGAVLPACAIWGPVLQSLRARWDTREIASDAVGMEHSFWRFWRGLRDHGPAYREAHEFLFESLGSESGIGFLVDSSKTAYRYAWRPLALTRNCGFDVRVMHLMRHPSRVLASCLKGRNSRLVREPHDRRRLEVPITLVGWNLANLFAALNGRILGPGRYLRVDFDDLLQAPGKVLDRIGRFLGIDMSPVIARIQGGDGIPPGHLIAANRMARASGSPVVFNADDAPRLEAMPARVAAGILSAPIYHMLRPAR